MQNAEKLDPGEDFSPGAQVEAEKNEARDAAGFGGLRIEAKVERLPADKRRGYQKVVALAKRAMRISEAGDFSEAARLAHKAVEIAPELALTNHVMGLMLFNLGRLSTSLTFFERAWKIDPNDAEIYQKLGLVAWKLDMLDAAERFYRIQLQLTPGAVDGAINLGGVLRDQGKYAEATEILRTAIYANQDNHDLWNSLGSVVNESGDMQQAMTFYQEALRLKPDFGRAHNNMANIYELTGELDKAIAHYDEALKDPADAIDEATMRHGRSMALLGAGRLREGWEAAESRLDPNRQQATLFTIRAPYWDGTGPERLRGKKVVLVGEQGLGDEVLFLNTAKDMIETIGPEGELRIACEYRLMELIKRSFPEAIVTHHLSATVEGRDVRVTPNIDQDADFWTAMGTPLRAFRNSLEDFPTEPGYLKPDPDWSAKFRDQLAGLGDGLKVGILWKSLKMDARRSRAFSAFDAWEPVLLTAGVDFVNLQYGQVDEELELARERFGVTIHQPRDIDLKMDLDKVAALASSCDVVIGPMNASSNLAAACGSRVWFIHPRKSAWTLLGADRQYWYPQSRSFFGEGFADWDYTLATIAGELASLASRRGS